MARVPRLTSASVRPRPLIGSIRGNLCKINHSSVAAIATPEGLTSSTATGFQIASPRNVTKPPTAAASKTFIWGAGIECSFIPHLEVDQFEWTQHNRFWKEDFRRARDEVGVSALRYALPWHEIEVQPGRFNWSAADERVAFAAELGLELYLDVMHFGTPTWLRQAAGDPEFPESLERFTTALVERLPKRDTYVVPLQ